MLETIRRYIEMLGTREFILDFVGLTFTFVMLYVVAVGLAVIL